MPTELSPAPAAVEPGRIASIAQLAARVLLAAIFLWAAVPKLLDPASFAQAIDNYRMLPGVLVAPLAVTLPVVELVVAFALLAGPLVRGAGLLAALMLLAFGLAMAQAKLRGIDLDCGCFGAAAKTQVTWGGIVRNLLLCVLGFGVALGKALPSRPRLASGAGAAR